MSASPKIYHLTGEPQWALALDFGGTKHSLGLLEIPPGDFSSQDLLHTGWKAHQRVLSPVGADAHDDLRTVFRLAGQMTRTIQLRAIGVSFGGPVDGTTGTVRLSHHVPGWENTPLAALLSDVFNVPAFVDNDANVAALGEFTFGAGASSLLYITVSTGVGGGWVLDGKIWRGADRMAGEIGHTVVSPKGPRCLCGKRGCVERLASGRYMVKDAKGKVISAIARIHQGDQDEKVLPAKAGGTLLALAENDPQNITGEIISQAAAQGDALAWRLLQRSAQALGVGIGNAANLLNPELVIVGGGVAKSGKRYWSSLRKAAKETALPEISVNIVPAALGDDAPLWGAIALVLEQLSNHEH